MPAAVVIPVPIAYIKVVAAKKLVVGSCTVCGVRLPVFRNLPFVGLRRSKRPCVLDLYCME